MAVKCLIEKIKLIINHKCLFFAHQKIIGLLYVISILNNLVMTTIVTENYLINKGFEKETSSIGWAKFRKNEFELVEIPLKNGRFIIGFEYQYCLQVKYKYPIKTNELEQLYKILIGKEL